MRALRISSQLWFRRLDGIALLLFAMGTGFLHGKNQLRLLGIFMIGSFFLANAGKFLRSLNWLRPVPTEMKFYTAWVLWVFTTGPLVATDRGYFLVGARVLAQMFVMVWVSYGILRVTNSGENAVFFGLIAGGLVEIILVVASHYYTGVMEYLVYKPQYGERITGLTTNPNSLGFHMVWGVTCCLIFWKSMKKKTGWMKKILVPVFVVAAAYVLLASGSRKSLVAFVFVLWAAVTFALTEGIGTGLKKVAASIFLGIMALWLFFTYGTQIAANTPVGKRWNQLISQGGGNLVIGIEHESRYEMYVDGLRIFIDHPVFGVGLNNFGKYFYTGEYSHSDYIEPLATTGLIGFILYQAFYVFLFLRLRRLLKIVDKPLTRYKLKMMLIGLGAIMIIGFGAPHYTSQPVFLLLVAFSVYTWNLKRQIMSSKVQVRSFAPYPNTFYRRNLPPVSSFRKQGQNWQ